MRPDDQRIEQLLKIIKYNEITGQLLLGAAKIAYRGMHLLTQDEYALLHHVIEPAISRIELPGSIGYHLLTLPEPILIRRPGFTEDQDYKCERYIILVPDLPDPLWIDLPVT